MSTIDSAEVERVASLARIKLTPTEVNRIAGELSVISDAIARVSEVVSPDIPATSHPVPLCNVMRPDEVAAELVLTPQDALAGAPAQDEDKFLVPQILGEE